MQLSGASYSRAQGRQPEALRLASRPAARYGRPVRRATLSWILSGALLACADARQEQDPGATVRKFIESMDRSVNDPAALEEAYRLLDSRSQRELQARALKAETLVGHAYQPWEMLVQGRFRLRFAPRKSGGLVARVQGDTATVIAQGARPQERAEIPLVREGGRWRLRLGLPVAQPTGAGAL